MADDSAATATAVDTFNEAFNRHDVDAVMAAMTDDCVFESTSPPFGERHEGQDAVRAAWESFFASTPTAHFDAEDVITTGGSALKAAESVRAAGGNILGVLALVDREEGGREAISEAGLQTIALVKASELVALIPAR